MDERYQIAPLIELDANEYISNKRKEIMKRVIPSILLVLLISGTVLVFITLNAHEGKRLLAVGYYGIVFVLGIISLIYLCVRQMKGINRQSIKHVYTGEAVIDSEELNQIQYRDIRGNYITTECSLLEDIDQEISDIVCITLEDERIVKVRPRNISDSSITN
ncbi:hypothetical protein M2145_002729 [Lachnospiraceae bacterium PF1-21]|uniref:hypothetical protein n=1 Tax=Ohessyouella blattaphilus TaxID=2949333 RepID=UPI003E2B4B43